MKLLNFNKHDILVSSAGKAVFLCQNGSRVCVENLTGFPVDRRKRAFFLEDIMPKGVYKRTEWHRRINRDSHKGIKHSNATKEKMSKSRKGKLAGEKNPCWKGGECKKGGYIYIWKPAHPFSNSRGYIARSRLVVEQKIGRYLNPKEIVHHKNEIKDKDIISNLKLLANKSKHTKLHNARRKRRQNANNRRKLI